MRVAGFSPEVKHPCKQCPCHVSGQLPQLAFHGVDAVPLRILKRMTHFERTREDI
jgi:hypothetical protein